MAEALANVEDAFGAVVEIYRDRGRPLPSSRYLEDANGPLSVETIVSVPWDTGRPPASWRIWGVTKFQGEAEALTEDGSIRERKKTLCCPTRAAGT